MENREQLILAEIKSLMSSVRSQLELLDAKMAELQQVVESDAMDVVPIDLDINIDESFVDEVVPGPEPIEQQIPMDVDDDLPFDDVSESEPEISEEAQEYVTEDVADEAMVAAETEVAETEVAEAEVPAAAEAAAAEEEAAEEEEEEEEEEEPLLMSEPEPVKIAEVLKTEAPKAVIDVMTDKYAWRTDMPGTPVKDIRSAISLNDRIIFINYLFKEDPILFQDALTRVNQMSSLDEVVAYAVNEHPEWDLSSEVIYRFMMAVRRRIR